MWIKVKNKFINLNNVTYIVRHSPESITFFFNKPNDDGDGWVEIYFSSEKEAEEFLLLLESLISPVLNI